jgi:hypothetical protein
MARNCYTTLTTPLVSLGYGQGLPHTRVWLCSKEAVMPTRAADETTARVAQAHLEWAYLAEYLRGLGYSLEDLQTMPAETAKALMRDASLFASMRMSEVEARSNLIEELHGGPRPM